MVYHMMRVEQPGLRASAMGPNQVLPWNKKKLGSVVDKKYIVTVTIVVSFHSLQQ